MPHVLGCRPIVFETPLITPYKSVNQNTPVARKNVSHAPTMCSRLKWDFYRIIAILGVSRPHNSLRAGSFSYWQEALQYPVITLYNPGARKRTP